MYYDKSRLEEIKNFLLDENDLTTFVTYWESYFQSTDLSYLLDMMRALLTDPDNLSRTVLILRASLIPPTSRRYINQVAGTATEEELADTTYVVSCESGCELNCQTGCELGCEVDCQIGCEISCEVTCEGACETGCETYCQHGCQLSSQ